LVVIECQDEMREHLKTDLSMSLSHAHLKIITYVTLCQTGYAFNELANGCSQEGCAFNN